jgi:hypothetical protein
LGALLEDLEIIELETVLDKQQYNVPGASREDDEDYSKNK